MSRKEKSDTGLKVTVTPFGPTREELQAIGERVLTLESVRKCLWRSKARLLYVEALNDDGDKGKRPRPPGAFGLRCMTIRITVRSSSTETCAMRGTWISPNRRCHRTHRMWNSHQP